MRFVPIAAIVLILALFAACEDKSDYSSTPAGADGLSPTPCGSEAPESWMAAAPGVVFDNGVLFVDIADDATERGTGLMNRACLGEDWGMLFVYLADSQNTFWMKDTLIPLSIAWIKADGTILEIEDMHPQTEDQHSAPAPFRYAIEAKQGWFTEHGVKPGDKAIIPPGLTAS